MMRALFVAVFCLALVVCLLPAGSSAEEKLLMMATTTSTDNTGLLGLLAPEFQRATGIELRWVAVGTGKALELGKNCDVDVLLVHAPEAEEAYVQAGYGVDRSRVMANDFLIVGPREDPAGLKGLRASDALRALAAKEAPFATRGDRSGTHKKELSLWAAAGMSAPDREPWYLETGQGMLETLRVAADRNTYTLTDRGTYIKFESLYQEDPPLVPLVEGEPDLLNLYSVLVVNPQRCPTVRYDAAQAFIRWITSPAAQELIGNFRLMGKQLFRPLAQ